MLSNTWRGKVERGGVGGIEPPKVFLKLQMYIEK